MNSLNSEFPNQGFLAEILDAVHGNSPLPLPLPLPPEPPRPPGRSARVRSRYNKCYGLWKSSVRVIRTLNATAGTQTSFVEPADERPTRFRFSNASPVVRDCWAHVISRIRRLESARRRSTLESDATGVSFMSRIRKALCDEYVSTNRERVYVP